MADTTTESPAERQVRLMRTDLTTGFDDILASLQEVTRSGGRLATTGGSLVEREIAMAVDLSESLRDALFAAEALDIARSQPLNIRLRADGHRLVDVLLDVGGVTVHGALRAADTFFAQRPKLAETEANAPATIAASA